MNAPLATVNKQRTIMSSNAEGDKPPVEKFSITVEFTGGLEILFANTRKLQLSIPAKQDDGKRPNIAWLIHYLVEHEMKDKRKELFVLEEHVRPGILVLINDADWELEGEEAYEIQPGDNILFVSTLHGG